MEFFFSFFFFERKNALSALSRDIRNRSNYVAGLPCKGRFCQNVRGMQAQRFITDIQLPVQETFFSAILRGVYAQYFLRTPSLPSPLVNNI